MRIEPPPSEPCASGSTPAATAAAAPPDEPPGVREVSHGLRQAPFSSDSVTQVMPNSGVFDLPSTTKPASFIRRTTAASAVGHVVGERARRERRAHAGGLGQILDEHRHAARTGRRRRASAPREPLEKHSVTRKFSSRVRAPRCAARSPRRRARRGDDRRPSRDLRGEARCASDRTSRRSCRRRCSRPGPACRRARVAERAQHGRPSPGSARRRSARSSVAPSPARRRSPDSRALRKRSAARFPSRRGFIWIQSTDAGST